MIILTMGLVAPIANGQSFTESGVWLYQETTDEFTDKVRRILTIVAEEPSPSGNNITLNISCGEDIPTIIIVAGGHILNKSRDINDLIDIDYRIDKLKASKAQVFSNGSAFGPYPRSKQIPFIKSMFNHDKLLIRFPTYNSSETVTFKITNIEDEVKPIREACNW